MFDENPQVGAKKFEFPVGTVKMEFIEPNEKIGEENPFWGCPKCKTDNYLMDITEEEEIKPEVNFTKAQDIKLMILQNFIDHIEHNSKEERERLYKVAFQYVEEDHVDEITQAGFVEEK